MPRLRLQCRALYVSASVALFPKVLVSPKHYFVSSNLLFCFYFQNQPVPKIEVAPNHLHRLAPFPSKAGRRQRNRKPRAPGGTEDRRRAEKNAEPREFPSRRRTTRRRGDSWLTNGGGRGGHLHNLATLLPSRPRDSFRSRKNLHVHNQPLSFPPSSILRRNTPTVNPGGATPGLITVSRQ